MEVGRWLRTQGNEMIGVRLDSGDLAWLSIEARRLLDEAGFPKAIIFGLQRAGRDDHPEPQGPGGADRRLGRRHAARHRRERRRSRRRLQAGRDAGRAGRAVAPPPQGLRAGGQDHHPRHPPGQALSRRAGIPRGRHLGRADGAAGRADPRRPGRPDAPARAAGRDARRGPAGPDLPRRPPRLRSSAPWPRAARAPRRSSRGSTRASSGPSTRTSSRSGSSEGCTICGRSSSWRRGRRSADSR